MIVSKSAKAWVALIVTVLVGVAGQVANLNLVSGDAQHTLTVVVGIVTAFATTAGVYVKANAP